MPKSDMATSVRADIQAGLALLTRLPLPALQQTAFERQARAVWSFPLAGLIVGGIAAGVAGVAVALGLTPAAAAGLVLFVQVALTGAMHEDGLADTADGFWGGWHAERRLEIMKDSRIGTYGVLALILSMGLRWGALAALIPNGVGVIIAVAAMSRGCMPPLMHVLPLARDTGLSHGVGRPSLAVAWAAPALGLLIASASAGAAVLVPTLFAALAVVGLGLLARAKIGGQTGDVLGASQQVAEIVLLVGLAAQLGQ